MRLPPLVPGIFVARDNRFRATVRVHGALRTARVASPGRMRELLTPGSRVWLAQKDAPHRKTPYDLLLSEQPDSLVSLDSHLPNALWAEYLREHGWRGEVAMSLVPEQRLGASRLDFLLTDERGREWMEIKSVTLVKGDAALFPDAPTPRGARHVGELIQAVTDGERGTVIFVVQRSDASVFRPHAETDPALARALLEAQHAGVTIQAYVCTVSLQEVAITRQIPVELKAAAFPPQCADSPAP